MILQAGKTAYDNPERRGRKGAYMQNFDLQRFSEGAEALENEASENTLSLDEAAAAGDKVSFDELIKGEYRKDFTDRVNDIVSKRFKSLKRSEERLNFLSESFAPEMEKRGAKTLEELIEKLKGNEKRVSESEIKKDMLLENYKRRTVERQYSDWLKESDEVKKMYPDFDIRRELKNPVFKNGLKLGMDIKALYRAIHFDEISKEIEDRASSLAAHKAAALRGRPSEIGSSSPKAVKSAFNVNALTDEEMESIVKRIAKGDKISFSR